MPVTGGHVPGVTSGLRRIPMDPRRYRSGRWLLLAEGVLVSAFGIAGLISAALQPHEGPTGAPVLGFEMTAPHSAILLAFGLVAIAAVGNRRAAVTVTALSAIAYFMLLFFSSVATARAYPTPLGFHAAHIVLHAVLGVVNLALLMWLIPDELGDEAWGPRRGRSRDRRQPSAVEAVTGPPAGSLRPASTTQPEPRRAAAAVPAQELGAHKSPPRHQVVAEQPRQNEPSTRNVQNSPRPKRPATRKADGVLSHRFLPVAVAVAAAVVIVIWMRRRR
jgi:Domain of unknown function (DUF4383)